MRIGTWNLDCRILKVQHLDLLLREQCDVWLLTEVNPLAVNPKGVIAGFNCHLTAGVMGRKQHWAAVLSKRALSSLPDPHLSSAAAIVNGITFCSTILPWSGCRKYSPHPWVGDTIGEMTKAAIESLSNEFPKSDLVWGGDWNHSLQGRVVGSIVGRDHILAAIKSFSLQVPTTGLLCQKDKHQTIDHIAVPSGWRVKSAARVMAEGLSDHDAYVIEVH
jgi:hypothetical protein